MKTYIISDTHFFHENIIGYEQRPFNNVWEMNQCIIDEWNAIIKPEDVVIHCGDFSLGKTKETEELARSLSGHIILIKGNHDHGSKTFYEKRCGFYAFVKEGHIIYDHIRLIISHIPTPYIGADKNIHGHTHSQIVKKDDSIEYINVCVDVTDYRPVDLEEII